MADVKVPAGTMNPEQITENLDFAEPLFKSGDPYARQHGFDTAAHAYRALALYQEDVTLRMACLQAGAQYRLQAARVRFKHGIPTIFPRTEAELLGLGRCDACGRPWQVWASDACPECPRLLFGPTPSSREEAGTYPEPSPVTPANWVSRVDGEDD